MLPEVLEERRVLDGLLHEGYCGAQIKKLDGTVATLCDQGCDLPGAKGCLDSRRLLLGGACEDTGAGNACAAKCGSSADCPGGCCLVTTGGYQLCFPPAQCPK